MWISHQPNFALSNSDKVLKKTQFTYFKLINFYKHEHITQQGEFDRKTGRTA